MFNTKSTQQWRVEYAAITADRGVKKEVTDFIAEIMLYENIYVPYVTGRIAFADNTGIFTEMKPMGSERLDLVIKAETPGVDHPVSGGLDGKKFVMKRIEESVKANAEGTSSLVIFELIEEHAIASNLKKLSRTIKDNFVLEILKCGADMGAAVDISRSRPSKQTKWKGYIPYLSPLDAIRWMMNRATNHKEMPYFLYSNMHESNIRLASLDILMEQTPFNAANPYVFSSATVQSQEYETGGPTLESLAKKHWHINSIRAKNMGDQMAQVQKGASTGSRLSVTNINGDNPIIASRHNSMMESIGKMGPLFRGNPQNIYDPAFSVRGAGPMHVNDAAQYHTIVSENIYTQEFKSFHYEESIDEYMPVLTANAVRAAMQKNTYEVSISGAKFLENKKGVGDLVELRVYADNTDLENAPEQIDKMKSGTFLVTGIAHTFSIPAHTITMEVTKFSYDPSLG